VRNGIIIPFKKGGLFKNIREGWGEFGVVVVDERMKIRTRGLELFAKLGDDRTICQEDEDMMPMAFGYFQHLF
jgi:hypothetical protein